MPSTDPILSRFVVRRLQREETQPQPVATATLSVDAFSIEMVATTDRRSLAQFPCLWQTHSRALNVAPIRKPPRRRIAKRHTALLGVGR